MEANEDVVDLKVLLGKLQENCEAVFAPLGQSAAGDLDVDAVVAQHGPPADVLGPRQPGLDGQDPSPGGGSLLRDIQPIIRVK